MQAQYQENPRRPPTESRSGALGGYLGRRPLGKGTRPSLHPVPRPAAACCQHRLSWLLAKGLQTDQVQNKKFHLVPGKKSMARLDPKGPTHPLRKSCFLCLFSLFKQSPRARRCPALTPGSLTDTFSQTPSPESYFPLRLSLLISSPDLYLLLPHLSRDLVSSPFLVLTYPVTLSNFQPFSGPRLPIGKKRPPFSFDIPGFKV